MNAGHIEQLGSPEAIFHNPDNRFTAEFFGTADFLPAWQEGDLLACEVGSAPWPVVLAPLPGRSTRTCRSWCARTAWTSSRIPQATAP